jgi:Na+-translocating ferredoxin:NAD+ oxidoreductase RnfG subunit
MKLSITNILSLYYVNMHKSVLLTVVAFLFIATPAMIFGATQQSTPQQSQITQEQMQQQQYENFKQTMPLSVQQNQMNETQMTPQSQQQENEQLSIITQEKMQQQQFENFKELLSSVRDKQIQVIQE